MKRKNKHAVITEIAASMFHKETKYLCKEIDKLMDRYSKQHELPMGAICIVLLIPTPEK